VNARRSVKPLSYLRFPTWEHGPDTQVRMPNLGSTHFITENMIIVKRMNETTDFILSRF